MANKKYLLHTFDYELFLGPRSGTVEECMLAPTYAICEILERFGIRGVFFVDTTCLWSIKAQSEKYAAALIDFKKITKQLKELYQAGHYIYPHLHPHWLDAIYHSNENYWGLEEYRKYRFHHTSMEERKDLFSSANQLFTEILGKEYSMEAYRAGGWCIQPFNDFLPLFEQYNIKADFSVLAGKIAHTTTIDFDFSTVKKDYYTFSDSVVEEDKHGKYSELTISSIKLDTVRQFLSKQLDRVLWRMPFGRPYGKGIGAAQMSLQNFSNDAYINKEMASIELLNRIKLGVYSKYLEEHSYMQCISHPKMVSRHNLNVFEKFLNLAYKRYEIESDWKVLWASELNPENRDPIKSTKV